MALEKYFTDEMDYLRQLARVVAKEKPYLAAFLSEKGSDPDVERLLEGMAFLAGNLREKIDDEFPELTHGLLNMLWPNYLRPVPSMALIEYTPQKDSISAATRVTRGTRLLSQPVYTHSHDEPQQRSSSSGGFHCTFTQSRDLWLLPLTLDAITVTNSNEMAIMDMVFSASEENSLNALALDKLRFGLGESGYNSFQLYFWFSYYLQKAELVVDNSVIELADFDFVPSGFEREDALLPHPKNAAMGYRILQEYFCFPENFLFFDVKGIPRFADDIRADQFSLRLYFNRPLPPEVKVRCETIRLHCVPAVNLFSHHSESILLDGTQAQYPLQVSHLDPDLYDIFSVDKVQSWLKNDKNQSIHGVLREYAPFESFHHQMEYARGRTKLYYRIRSRQSLFRAGLEHHISFVRGDETQCVLRDETVSVSLTCTNRKVPISLRVADITIQTDDHPSFATFRNITRPTAPLYPVLDGSLHWSLISNMSLNYLSLLDRDALCQILRSYDLPAMNDRQAARASQKRLDGILRIETKPVDRLFRGVPVRGLATTLWLEQSAFSCEGELYLFGSILARFFSLYASVNAFHLLTVINASNKECYQWPVQTGQHPLI
ncbi:type VI secretion system baseplate subunit TssF [Erwinia tracheiphila]|uniref:type VI secretion system baseplate subunit TssF n=1 Tax=Erwinia tracheiphila TaxID=65700 RepID=UPI001F43DC74|nr:type VI secretion system baseplate subunit TssF [Erwinia tracheiphila]UIA91029.1 type VI secretion system baseplate subunit TssF [Erwinia tracheiphila]